MCKQEDSDDEKTEWEKSIAWLDEDDYEVIDHDDLGSRGYIDFMDPIKCLRMVLLQSTKEELVAVLTPADERLIFPNLHSVTHCIKLRCPKIESFDCYANDEAIVSPLNKFPECSKWVISKTLEPLAQQSGIRLAVQVSPTRSVSLSMANILHSLRRKDISNIIWYSPIPRSEAKDGKESGLAAGECKEKEQLEEQCDIDLELPSPAVAQWVTSKDDPLVADFINMKENPSDEKIISEGGDTLMQLLKSDLEICCILLKDTQFLKHKDMIIKSQKKCHVAVCGKRTLKEITTYKSVGPATVLASAWKPQPQELFTPRFNTFNRILALDGLVDAENIGSLLRSAACFDIDAVIISMDCCDVWYRRCVRVSMGHVFHIPVFKVDLVEALERMHLEGFETYGAIVQHDTVPLSSIKNIPDRWCLVVGSEHFGIAGPVRDQCTTKVKIEMSPAVDSLNVGVAAAILLHHFQYSG